MIGIILDLFSPKSRSNLVPEIFRKNIDFNPQNNDILNSNSVD